MDQPLRALTTLLQDRGSTPSTHMAAPNFLELACVPTSSSGTEMVSRHTLKQNTHTHRINTKIKISKNEATHLP